MMFEINISQRVPPQCELSHTFFFLNSYLVWTGVESSEDEEGEASVWEGEACLVWMEKLF